MQVDWRLRLLRQQSTDSITETFDSLYSDLEWDHILTPIAQVILNYFEDPGNSQQFTNSVSCIKEPARTIAGKILGCVYQRENIDWLSSEAWYLGGRLGRVLAGLTSSDIDEWEKIADRISEFWPLYEAWVNTLPIEHVIRNQAELMKLPECTHPLELVDTWGYMHERKYWSSFMEHVEQNEKYKEDPWHYVDNLYDSNNEFRFSASLKLRSDLLIRLGNETWIAWVIKLPFIEFQEAALSYVEELDTAQALLSNALHLHNADPMNVAVGAVMIVRHNLGLWDKIQENLSNIANSNSEYWKVRLDTSKIANELSNWQDNELPTRVKSLVNNLQIENNEIGHKVAFSILRNIKIRNIKKETGLVQFRSSIIKHIAELSLKRPDLVMELVLPTTNKKQGLHSSLLLFFEMLDIWNDDDKRLFRDRLVDIFKMHIKSNEFYWDGKVDYNEDDSQLIWLMAGALSTVDEPLELVVQLLNLVYVPREGWNFDNEEYKSSVTKVAYILVIATMCAEWLIHYKRKKEAVSLYKLTWLRAHQWVRSIFDDFREEVTTVLIQLYARLNFIFPGRYTRMAYDGVQRLDSLRHVTICLRVLLDSLKKDNPDTKLPSNLQRQFHRRYKERFLIIRSYSRMTATDIEWYTKSYELLSPDFKL
jgi:hypothetical protein